MLKLCSPPLWPVQQRQCGSVSVAVRCVFTWVKRGRARLGFVSGVAGVIEHPYSLSFSLPPSGKCSAAHSCREAGNAKRLLTHSFPLFLIVSPSSLWNGRAFFCDIAVYLGCARCWRLFLIQCHRGCRLRLSL